MDSVVPQLLLVAFLVVLNAFFAGTELALVSLREGQLQRLETASRTGRVLAGLAREPNRFLATIQIGITLAGFLASAAAAVSLAEPLEGPLGFLGGAAEPAAVVSVTLILAYLTLVFGELAPKRVAMQRAERWGLLAARPLAVMSVLTRPVVWLLSRSTDLAVRLLGGDPTRQREEITEDELRDMVAMQATFSDKQRMIIDGAFEISERTLREILRPRQEVVSLAADQLCSDAIAALVESGRSRAPVTSTGSLDDVVGVVHLRDLIAGGSAPVGTVSAEVPVLPESLDVLEALHKMQSGRDQLAAVVNEHGAVQGIVTMEDLIEELVGEIYDESDREVVESRRLSDGTLLLSGTFPVHDLVDVGVDGVPEGPYATVAGLVLDRIKRLPETPGDRVEIGRWIFEVTGVGRRRITQVTVRPGTDLGQTPRIEAYE